MTWPRTWTDDDLRRAVATSQSQREVMAKLGLGLSGGAYNSIHRNARRLGISLPIGRPPGRNRSWTDADLRRAIDGAESLFAIVGRLGLCPSGQTYEIVRRHAARLRLDLPDKSRRQPVAPGRNGERR